MDEWQKSLDYVRGSNIYVRGYLDLRACLLRLRAIDGENPLREGAFFLHENYGFTLRWIRGILAIKRSAL